MNPVNNLRRIGVSEEERDKRSESIFKEIMAENFPNLGKIFISEFTELIGHLKIPIHSNLFPIFLTILSKIKNKDRLLKQQHRKKSLSHTREPLEGY